MYALFAPGSAATFEEVAYDLMSVTDWRARVRAREAKGHRAVIVTSGIPFTITESYAESLLPYLKRYGELDSYKINVSRSDDGKPDGSITFAFFAGIDGELPSKRPNIPLIFNH